MFDKILEANKLIKVTDVKGKDYAEVNQRVKAFRFLYPLGSIETEILSLGDGVVVMKATAKDDMGKVLATGTAYEKEDSSFINKTSYIENCETSAVGRCLGFVGLGIDTSIASAEEVANAIHNQNQTKTIKKSEADALLKRFIADKISDEKVCECYKVESVYKLTYKQYDNINACYEKVKERCKKEE